MRRNPFTRRLTMTDAELAELCSTSAASAVRGMREQVSRDLKPTDAVLVKDVLRMFRTVERSIHRAAPTDIEKRLQGIRKNR